MRNERRISSWRRVITPHLGITYVWLKQTSYTARPIRRLPRSVGSDASAHQLQSCAHFSDFISRGTMQWWSREMSTVYFFLGYSNLSLKTTPHGSSRKGKQTAPCPNVVCLLDKFGGRENQRTIHPSIKFKIIYYITASLTNTALLESKHPGTLKLLDPDPLSHFLTLLSRAEIYWNMCAMFTIKASESF